MALRTKSSSSTTAGESSSSSSSSIAHQISTSITEKLNSVTPTLTSPKKHVDRRYSSSYPSVRHAERGASCHVCYGWARGGDHIEPCATVAQNENKKVSFCMIDGSHDQSYTGTPLITPHTPIQSGRGRACPNFLMARLYGHPRPTTIKNQWRLGLF